MKKINKGEEPQKLETYRTANPNGTWKQYRANNGRREQIQDQLRKDQGGLCAYCEIDLRRLDAGSNSDDVEDFRVEHFHPKSDTASEHNWRLDWHNLLACCHGGSNAKVVDAQSRFTSPDHSCDVPKKNQNWDEEILNPLHLPASPCLFKFSRAEGTMIVHTANCRTAGIDEQKAQNTIKKLRLDAKRLKRLRKAELDRVNQVLQGLVHNGMDVRTARNKLAKALIRKDAKGNWPRFFSALRDYLGSAAEEQLRNIGYIG